MAEVCVVHLVRRKNGVNPLRKFLKSYAENTAGVAHDLLIIFKGFSNKEALSEYYRQLRDFRYASIRVMDFGFDIRPYFIAAKTFNYQHFCFLNSFSIILSKDWLLKMYEHGCKKDVGLVGATGSYQSIYSGYMKRLNEYRTYPLFRRFLYRFLGAILLMRFKQYFPPFPNCHIRTNCFMISRETMKKIRCGTIYRKIDAYRFESGKSSLTRQIMDMNLRVLVVGDDGKGYGKEDWYKSGTFFQGDQNNLLVADNMTNKYLNGDIATKWDLARRAWGDKADPLVR